MSKYFENWEKFSVDGSSADFFKKIDGDTTYIGFDSSSLTPPGPMLNASLAINLVKDTSTKIVMINHKFPVGLIPKIEGSFNYTNEELDGGKVKLVFSLKEGKEVEKIDGSCGSFASGMSY
ncbi:hypothetical protein CIG2463D_0610 [Campylobacter iguaniorum]|uniref:hypothetical protein n=1 Tax=Campylobacter iguaniorum TaxID=1244531 RepID=UPI00073A03C2|nr:hypothetical protein [Campylobacter iguaniorum]ALV24205.1 hypothetical protein CIG2463D_0610 [Campylobacter iguaniorum]